MATVSLGSRINILRKRKGITQDELGKNLGVTAQAVSNWECGGTPDAELLPRLADYFDVTIDNLFGRSDEVKNDIEKSILTELYNTDVAKRFDKAYRYCWSIQQGLFDLNPDIIIGSFSMPEAVPINTPDKWNSSFISDDGVSTMRLNKDFHYFFLMPEPESGHVTSLKNGETFEKLFALLGKPKRMKTLLYMYSRKHMGISVEMLAKQIGIDKKEASVILEEFLAQKFLIRYDTEMESSILTSYILNEYSAIIIAIIPFLYFAAEITEESGYCISKIIRNKPLL